MTISKRLLLLVAGLILTAIILSVIAFFAFAKRYWTDNSTRERIASSTHLDMAFTKDSDLLFNSDYSIQVCCNHSLELSPEKGVADWASSMRFEVRPEDPRVKGSKRSEIRFRPDPYGKTMRYRARLYVPEDWQNSDQRVIALQWHGTRDIHLREGGRVPPLEFFILNGEFHLEKSWDTRLHSGFARQVDVEGRKMLWSAPIKPGTWEDFEFLVKWSVDDDGEISMFRNGEIMLTDTGPNAHNDLIGPYLKFGVYIPNWKANPPTNGIKKRVLFFDTVSVEPHAEEN
ncbi:MAG: polysaccharide lyase [Roseibium sp.]|uniref:polysaccharide lyase n=1 Tax=Roseibium sp. TaxID=1936156 RepID=UPI00260181B6|nr:polysaccharide lyase [Roseibium sp.]MCV0428498.1 polysaccharide lyase [Roseibium sp.]